MGSFQHGRGLSYSRRPLAKRGSRREANARVAEKEALSAKFARWFTLYAAFLFLAGWSYQESYFNVFGVDTTWLEFGVNDTIAKGFSVLFGAGVWLSWLYMVVFLLSAIEELLSTRSRVIDSVVVLSLLLLFPLFYLQATKVGRTQANIDRGLQSGLPVVTFSSGSCDYEGKLFYVKGDLLYVYEMHRIPESQSSVKDSESAAGPTQSMSCPFEVATTAGPIPQLFLARLADLQDVRVTYSPTEVAP